MKHCLHFFESGNICRHHFWQKLLCTLDRAFCPSELLAFESVDLYRHLGRRDHIVQKHEFPAKELSPVTEIQILGERIILPSARFIDAPFSPYPCSTIEVQKQTLAVPCSLLYQEMTIYPDSKYPGQK